MGAAHMIAQLIDRLTHVQICNSMLYIVTRDTLLWVVQGVTGSTVVVTYTTIPGQVLQGHRTFSISRLLNLQCQHSVSQLTRPSSWVEMFCVLEALAVLYLLKYNSNMKSTQHQTLQSTLLCLTHTILYLKVCAPEYITWENRPLIITSYLCLFHSACAYIWVYFWVTAHILYTAFHQYSC